MKIFLTAVMCAIAFAVTSDVTAQISTIKVGVDGFTCSLCAKGVEGQFSALDFISSVRTDLKNTTFTLGTKKSPEINFRMVREAVTDGGFTVREILVEGSGKVKIMQDGKITVELSNAEELEIHGAKVELTDKGEVEFKGKLSTDLKSVAITEIRKL